MKSLHKTRGELFQLRQGRQRVLEWLNAQTTHAAKTLMATELNYMDALIEHIEKYGSTDDLVEP